MKTERVLQIEQYILDHEIVSIRELMDHFHISINTLRRDLSELEERGSIQKIYGGAKKADVEVNSEEPNKFLKQYSERDSINTPQKTAIAQKAAAMIRENDTIFIDTGTSTVPILNYLDDFHHLTIVTNSVYVLFSALNLSRFTVVGLPGVLKNETASLVGDQCLNMIERYNINKAFMACTTFSLENGVCNSSIEEYSIKRRVIEKSSENILLVDASKFDRSSLLTFADPEDFHYIVTDEKPSQKYIDYFSKHRIGLILADADTGTDPKAQ